MTTRTRWLAVAVLAAAVVVFIMWRGCRRAPGEEAVAPLKFSVEEFPVSSPGLAVGPAEILATRYRGYTDWACLLECREPAGCHAEVRLVVSYVDGGAEKRLLIPTTLNADEGETMRIGRTQRPPTGTIENLSGLHLEIVRPIAADVPTPFIID